MQSNLNSETTVQGKPPSRSTILLAGKTLSLGDGKRLSIVEKPNSAFYDKLTGLNGMTIYHTEGWHRVLSRSCGWDVHGVAMFNEANDVDWFLPFVQKRRLSLSPANVIAQR